MVLVSNVYNWASAQWHKTETFSAVRNSSPQTAEVEHHRGEKKRTKWQGPSYFLGFLREQMQAISFSAKHETRHASSSLTLFHSLSRTRKLVGVWSWGLCISCRELPLIQWLRSDKTLGGNFREKLGSAEQDCGWMRLAPRCLFWKMVG